MLIAGGVKLTEKVIDYISDRIQGKGIDINKIKNSGRKKFLRNILNQILISIISNKFFLILFSGI